MSEHTPGPWRYCGEDRGGCICGHIWSESTEQQVATVTQGEWGDSYPVVVEKEGGPEARMERLVYGVVPEDEGKANARLIARAPEMEKEITRLREASQGQMESITRLRRERDQLREALEMEAWRLECDASSKQRGDWALRAQHLRSILDATTPEEASPDA